MHILHHFVVGPDGGGVDPLLTTPIRQTSPSPGRLRRAVMVKAYLKYETAASFGVIASSAAAGVSVPNAARTPLVATGAVDAVLLWNMRKGEAVARFANSATRRAGAVTAVAVAPGGDVLAAGYADGSIRTWHVCETPMAAAKAGEYISEVEPLVTFNGHRSGVSCLGFELLSSDDSAASGKKKAVLAPVRLVSGSNDGDVIVWDLVEEAGAFRLAAHNDAVTAVLLLKHADSGRIISSSKDGLLRVYDVETQHCVQTVVGHRAEVWAMSVDPSHTLLMTGSVDAEIRAFKLNHDSGAARVAQVPSGGDGKAAKTKSGELEVSFEDENEQKMLQALGSVQRQSAAARVGAIHIEVSRGETFAIVSAVDKSAELFRVRAPGDAERHRKRRRKRRLEKVRREAAATAEESAVAVDDAATTKSLLEAAAAADDDLEAKDFLVSARVLRLVNRIRAIVILPDSCHIPVPASKTLDVQLLVQCSNNALEIYRARVVSKRKNKKSKRIGVSADNEEAIAEVDDEDEESGAVDKLVTLEFPGHRGDIRSIALTPDDRTLLSASRRSLKLWNISTQKCIRTMTPSGYGLCTAFLGADARLAAVGTKEGALEIFDLGSGAMMGSMEKAHNGAIWSMCLDDHIYEANAIVTGGADKRICIWGVEDVMLGGKGSIKLQRTLEMPDEVLCVRVAHGRERPVLLASMMDATVRAFFLDTLEPYMSFYGHKLPVMAMDVSSDGLVLATGSADKTIKLWGMDFGDCRRSLRAHADSVLAIAFQPKTHYLFSGSRDGTLKYWDADKFEFIAELEGQRGEVWSLAVSSDGEIVTSASHDKLMRVWRRTDEPLFLEEEQDRRQDEMFESALIDEDVREATKARSKVVGFMEDPSKGEASAAGKRSLDTVKGGEKLLEALELCEAERRRVTEEPDESANPMLLGLEADAYMLRTLELIRTADLEEALHLLPLDGAMSMLEYCSRLLASNCSLARLSVEMLCRAALYLLKLHHSQIVAGAAERKLVAELHSRMQLQLEGLRRRMGFNAAALSFWQTELADRDDAPFKDAGARAFNLQKKKKQKVPTGVRNR